VVAALLQAREVVGSVVVASAGANKQGMVDRRARWSARRERRTDMAP